MTRATTILLGLSLGLALTGCGAPSGEETAAAGEHTHATATVTTWTDSLELFMEHPPQVAGSAGEPWAIHLTRIDGWRPVREGSLTLFFTGPDGSVHTVRADAPARPGIFTPAPSLPEPGSYGLEMSLSVDGRSLSVPAGSVRVYTSQEELPHEEEAAAGGEGIAFLKEQQWEIPFAVARVERRGVPGSVPVTGELTAPADGTARVSAPVSGLVRRGGISLPAVGTRVRAGQALALLAPTDGDASYARLVGRVRQLEREVARAERLVEAEAVAEKRLVEARHDLSVARSALEALGGAPAGVTDPPGAGDPDADDYHYRLRSPLTGVVAESRLSPGQRVEAGEPAFTVVDPSVLWLRARVPAEEAARAAGASGATFRVEGGDATYRTDDVVAVGDVIDPESRTLPVTLRVENPDRRLKVGMLARGRLLVGDTTVGPAVPNEAIRDEDGLKVAYVETGGETFERRILELGHTDGRWTVVRSGLSTGERVVTAGTYQIHLSSVGGDEAATGHGHPH